MTILNKLGHGVSQSQLSEWDAATAEKQLQEQQDQAAFIPSNIDPTLYVTFCWDNNDILEETASGLGTTHCTNGIVVQRCVDSCAPPPPTGPHQPEVHFDKRRRSINAPVDPSFEHHIYGQRDGPLPVASDMDAISDTAKHSAQMDFVWGLARLMKANSDQLGQEEQKTPGWAGFHSLVESDRAIRRSVVGYLPVIPSSPTEMGTVYQLLLRSLAIANRLRQRSVVIALDQAIYSKACEIMIVWKEQWPLLQSLTSIPSTFAELASLVFNVITKPFEDGASRIEFVVDQYPERSIKSCERDCRARQGVLRVQITHRMCKCPAQWKKFLSANSNKVTIASFFADEWTRAEYAQRLLGRSLFVTYGNLCKRPTSQDDNFVQAAVVPALQCSHNEADTRLLLHAHHASNNGQQAVVIRSPDTDVAVLAVYHHPALAAAGSQLYFRTGTKQRACFIDIHTVRTALGERVSDALLRLHALTGCDSTSAFKGRGMRAGVNLAMTFPDLSAGLSELACDFTVSKRLHLECEKFVCFLYRKTATVEVNELRHQLFVSKASQNDHIARNAMTRTQRLLVTLYCFSVDRFV